VLLSDPEVAQFLKTEVVTSWEMVREVPKITVDFGNGKKISRTIAGNTVMYLCNEYGKVLDAYPGVYTPADFLKEVRASISATKTEPEALAWHMKEGLAAPVSNRAMAMTGAKAFIEAPLLKALAVPDPPAKPEDLESIAGRARGRFSTSGVPTPAYAERLFKGYAKMLRDLSKIPASAPDVLDSFGMKNGSADTAGQALVARDSNNNVRAVRPAIHLWMASLIHLPTPEESRDVLFKQVLHIPIDDPYLGLGSTIPGTGN
jgi:hypothetical protein